MGFQDLENKYLFAYKFGLSMSKHLGGRYMPNIEKKKEQQSPQLSSA